MRNVGEAKLFFAPAPLEIASLHGVYELVFIRYNSKDRSRSGNLTIMVPDLAHQYFDLAVIGTKFER